MQDGPRTKVKKVANRKITKKERDELEKRRKEEEQRWADIGEQRRKSQSKGEQQSIRGSTTIAEDTKQLNVDHDERMPCSWKAPKRREHRLTHYDFCSVDDMIDEGHKLIAKPMSSTEQEYSGATSSTSDGTRHKRTNVRRLGWGYRSQRSRKNGNQAMDNRGHGDGETSDTAHTGEREPARAKIFQAHHEEEGQR